MARRVPSPADHGSATSTGQARLHWPQPMQPLGVDEAGRQRHASPRRRRPSRAPAVTVAWVSTSIRSWWSTSSRAGSMKQEAQTWSGKISSSWAARPPSAGDRSTSSTLRSLRASARAAATPAAPPPTTTTSATTSISRRTSGWCRATRASPARTSRSARPVAASGAPPIHSTCSRRLTSCSRYGFLPGPRHHRAEGQLVLARRAGGDHQPVEPLGARASRPARPAPRRSRGSTGWPPRPPRASAPPPPAARARSG